MHPMFEKLVNESFINGDQIQLIEEAINEKRSIIVSGHKGWGILPLLATISTYAKADYSIEQVKTIDDLNAAADFHVMTNPKDSSFEDVIISAIKNEKVNLLTIKDPDHPYSLFKIMKDIHEEIGGLDKKFLVIECAKKDDLKHVAKITKVEMDETGKLKKDVIK
ncbi:MAG: hypothetical protein JXO44_10250 [Clostridia bacterium]|nr:hypothetical protein [Clostridia bacterium]